MIMWGSLIFCCALLAAVLLLRRWPLAALAVTLGGSVASMVLQPRPSYMLVVLACVVGLEICYIAATCTRKVSVTGAAMAAAGLLIPLLAVPSLDSLRGGGVGSSAIHVATIAVPLFIIIAWLIGHSIRQAQARAELVRAQAAAQATMAERLRIARELHDLVAHSTGIIAIQAGSGRRVFDARPDQARDALAAIEDISRETLAGLRRGGSGLGGAGPGAGGARGCGAPPRSPGRGKHRWARRPAWPTSTGWLTGPGTRACRSRWTGTAAGRRSRLTSTCQRSASSRRRSPTWSATPTRASARSRSTSRTGSYPLRSSTAGAAAAWRGPATGSPACASAPRCWAVTSRPARAPTVASASPPGCHSLRPHRPNDHPGHPGRRPAAGPRGPAQADRADTRHRRGRRGRNRCRGGPARQGHRPRRGRDGHPNAGDGRHRGNPDDHRRRLARSRARAHHVRRR